MSCLLFNTRCFRKRIYYYKATNQMFWVSLSWHSLIWSAINWSFIRVGLIKPFETKYGADLLQWIIKWLFLYQKRMVVKPRTIPEPFIVIRTDLGCFHCLFVLWFTVYFGWLLYQNRPFHGNGVITVCVKWHNLNNISHIKCKCLSIFVNLFVIFLHGCFFICDFSSWPSDCLTISVQMAIELKTNRCNFIKKWFIFALVLIANHLVASDKNIIK